MRTEAREAVVKVLYSRSINPMDADNTKLAIFKKLAEDKKTDELTFAADLLKTIDEYENIIVSTIDKNILKFREDRLYPIDRAILMIAVAEILYFDDIPAVVSVSEATNLAQRYSTETSADFVNGVLSGVIANV